jgi:ribonuclease E
MKKEILINVAQQEECRIAFVEDGRLEDLYVERSSQDNIVGNIYKGKIVNLEPSIQAVFVDFGVGKNGFLHISDVEPSYYRQAGLDPDEIMRDERRRQAEARARGHRPQFTSDRPRVKPPIQTVFQRGDEVLVQVIKEGIGNKGPTLTTYISIPGRYLVLMPALARVGVSRKIEDEKDRRRLKDILHEMRPPKGLGFIVRTAGAGRNRRELSRDMAYLLRLWRSISKRIVTEPAPVSIFEESDLIIRTIRDVLTGDVDSIVVDKVEAYERAKSFLSLVMPKYSELIRLYDGKEPLFHKYRLEDEIANIYKREVPLPNGGSIVIDQTEALVAIDVNTGNFRSDGDAEETAFRLNLIAAKEIARQLRLRDLGGVIVNDFIDMRHERHRIKLERTLHEAVQRDRARTRILRTSPFGLIEMTRQRMGASVKRHSFQDCPCCSGRGVVKTPESMAIEVLRMTLLAVQNPQAAVVDIEVNIQVASYLNNQKRRELADLEREGDKLIKVHGSESAYPEHLKIICYDRTNKIVKIPALEQKVQRGATIIRDPKA